VQVIFLEHCASLGSLRIFERYAAWVQIRSGIILCEGVEQPERQSRGQPDLASRRTLSVQQQHSCGVLRRVLSSLGPATETAYRRALRIVSVQGAISLPGLFLGCFEARVLSIVERRIWACIFRPGCL
jgi:hypothetical protein